jgi:hypothetical protein
LGIKCSWERSSRLIKYVLNSPSSSVTKEVDKQVKGMLNNELITPSLIPWSSPVVLVRQKDGTTRFCVDYRRLNAVTLNDTYPLRRIDDSFGHLSGSCWFSTLDLCSGYWQTECDGSDRHKTAFATMFSYKRDDISLLLIQVQRLAADRKPL